MKKIYEEKEKRTKNYHEVSKLLEKQTAKTGAVKERLSATNEGEVELSLSVQKYF
jgi:hypothetical protein